MTNQRGGSRPNSGRKPVGDQPMVTAAFSIRQDQLDWLNMLYYTTRESKSEVVRRALDKAMKSAARNR